MKPTLDFFFFYGSIYTYLTVMRVDELALAAGFVVRWRPFDLRQIILEQNNTGFTKNPIRMHYCWRDVERRAARHGIAFESQPPYPVDPDLLALRVGVVAAEEGWCPDYSKATYRAWFLERKVPGVSGNVEAILTGLKKPVGETLAKAAVAATNERLAQETARARELGIFGSLNIVIGTELFWGDDRVEDALEFARSSAYAGFRDGRRD